jgi:hypothetical protein
MPNGKGECLMIKNAKRKRGVSDDKECQTEKEESDVKQCQIEKEESDVKQCQTEKEMSHVKQCQMEKEESHHAKKPRRRGSVGLVYGVRCQREKSKKVML